MMKPNGELFYDRFIDNNHSFSSHNQKYFDKKLLENREEYMLSMFTLIEMDKKFPKAHAKFIELKAFDLLPTED